MCTILFIADVKRRKTEIDSKEKEEKQNISKDTATSKWKL